MDKHDDFALYRTIRPFTKLTRIVEYRFPDRLKRTFGVACLPKGMEIVNNEVRCTQKVPTIAVIDSFSNGRPVKIGRGTFVDHGVMVTKYAVRGLENEVGVLGLDTRLLESKDEWATYKGICDAIKELLRIQKCYRNIMALNLSQCIPCFYDDLSEKLKEKISERNVEEKKAELLAFLSKQTDGKYALAYQTIQVINQLVDEGVAVYMMAGNSKNILFNLFLLSNAQYMVSAYDVRNACEAFSNTKGNGKHVFRKIYNENNELISVTDGMIEILPHEIRKPSKLTRKKHELFLLPRTIRGTALSSPLKLNEDLKVVLMH